MARKKTEELSQFHREHILKAAKKLFYEKGVKQATMDEIAKCSEYSKSTIYVYFKNKEEIYHYIIHEYMELMQKELKRILTQSRLRSPEGPVFEENFFEICMTLVRLQEKNPMYLEGLLGNISVKKEDLEKSKVLKDIYETGEKVNAIIREMIEDGIAEGKIPAGIDKTQAIFMLYGSIGGIISMAENKKEYLEASLGKSKEEFLRESFRKLERSLL